MSEEAPDPFNRPDYEFIKMVQKQLLELRQQFIMVMGKSVFHPDELETLTTLLAQLLFTLKENLPKEEAIEKFWMYWNEPHRFIKDYPKDYYHIIYYKKSGEIWATPAKDENELKAKERSIRSKGGKILNTKIVPSPELIKELVQIVLDSASKAGLISLKLPTMNHPILFEEGEALKIISHIKMEIIGG